MTRISFVEALNKEMFSYIVIKEKAFAEAKLPRNQVFGHFKNEDEMLIDFCTWVLARRTK